MADMVGDKAPEVRRGKRYFGHDVVDVGELDQIVHYSYQFNAVTRTFSARLHARDCAGTGLDPKVADLDSDGTLEIVTGDRNGLSLLGRADPSVRDLDLAFAKGIRPDRL